MTTRICIINQDECTPQIPVFISMSSYFLYIYSILYIYIYCTIYYTVYICGKIIDPTPLMSLFGVAPVDTPLTGSYMNMMAFCSLLARRLILSKWKDSVHPTYGQWIREVMCHFHLEKIRYTIRGSTRKFYATWQPFISFVEGMAVTNYKTHVSTVCVFFFP